MGLANVVVVVVVVTAVAVAAVAVAAVPATSSSWRRFVYEIYSPSYWPLLIVAVTVEATTKIATATTTPPPKAVFTFVAGYIARRVVVFRYQTVCSS